MDPYRYQRSYIPNICRRSFGTETPKSQPASVIVLIIIIASLLWVPFCNVKGFVVPAMPISPHSAFLILHFQLFFMDYLCFWIINWLRFGLLNSLYLFGIRKENYRTLLWFFLKLSNTLLSSDEWRIQILTSEFVSVIICTIIICISKMLCVSLIPFLIFSVSFLWNTRFKFLQTFCHYKMVWNVLESLSEPATSFCNQFLPKLRQSYRNSMKMQGHWCEVQYRVCTHIFNASLSVNYMS